MYMYTYYARTIHASMQQLAEKIPPKNYSPLSLSPSYISCHLTATQPGRFAGHECVRRWVTVALPACMRSLKAAIIFFDTASSADNRPVTRPFPSSLRFTT